MNVNIILVLTLVILLINSASCWEQKDACEGNILNIDCGIGKVILIQDANYGRLDGSTCPHPQISNQNCKSQNAVGILGNSCNNKQQCSVSATNGVFGDPCVGTYKYLRVNYECLAAYPSRALDACEGNILNIDCGIGKVILIKDANYGRLDGTTCPHPQISDQNCKSQNAIEIVGHSCNNKQQCSVSATNGVFGDPCVGTYKYLRVNYECLVAAPCLASEFQCNDGTCISEKFVSNGIRDCRYGEDEVNADYLTQFACEGQAMHISCKKDEIISIINANYGRLTSKICSHNLMKDQNCWAKNSFTILSDRCNQKDSCDIEAINGVFGDPCVGTYKYLQVHYQCLKVAKCTQCEFQCNQGQCIELSKKCDGHWDCEGGEDEIGCSYLSEHACENSNLNLECPGEKVIHIISANYGRKSHHACTYQPTTNCLSAVSKKIVVDRCEEKKSCTVEAKNSQFGDPCVGTIKYLAVNFECLDKNLNQIDYPNAV